MAIIQEIMSKLTSLLSLKGVSGASPHLVLSLDEVLEAGGVDEPGSVRTRVEYHYSKLLIPRYFKRGQLGRTVHVGVDSSSRSLATPHMVVVVGSLAVSLGSAMESFTWPPIHGDGLERGPPFIALIPYTEYYGEASLPPFILSRRVAEPKQSPWHGLQQVSRELRVSMENWALENVRAIVDELAGSHGAGGPLVVMLDGPIFIAPEAGGLPAEQGAAWRELMRARVMAIEAAESRGIPVIGVVKRVESSTILSRTREFIERAERCVGDAKPMADLALIHLILRSGCDEERRGGLMFTPKIRVEYGQGWAPGKIVEYAVLLPSAWHSYSYKARVFRLEVTQRSLEILRDHGLDPESVLAGDTLARGSLEPASILISDKMAKAVSSAIKKSLIASLLSGETPLTYDEARGVEKRWRAG